MFTIRRINIASAFRVGLVGGAVMAAVTGLLFILLQGLLFSFLVSLMDLAALNGVSDSAAIGDASSFSSSFAVFSLATVCVLYAAVVVFAAVSGGISAALTAFVYNLTARWIGGLEIEITGDFEKSKRGLDDDLFA